METHQILLVKYRQKHILECFSIRVSLRNSPTIPLRTFCASACLPDLERCRKIKSNQRCGGQRTSPTYFSTKRQPEGEPEPEQVLYIVEPDPDNEIEPDSFPQSGWLRGSVADIATAIRVRATPISKIDAAADLLEKRIEIAAQQLETAIRERPSIGSEIEAILFQKAGEQTSRMAMLIVTNAFVFQSVLAGKPEMERVMSLKRMLSDNAKRLRYEQVIAGWDIILKVNYRPIFHVAKRLIAANCN